MDIKWPRRDTKFLFESWKTFHEWALLSNCFMMNLKLQNAAQRRVLRFHALRDFLERSLRFWFIDG